MFVFSWCPWLRPVVYRVSSMLNDLHFNMTALLALEAFHHLHVTYFLGCTDNYLGLHFAVLAEKSSRPEKKL